MYVQKFLQPSFVGPLKRFSRNPALQTLLCLTGVLWKYQVFCEIRSPVTTDEVILVQEYF